MSFVTSFIVIHFSPVFEGSVVSMVYIFDELYKSEFRLEKDEEDAEINLK